MEKDKLRIVDYVNNLGVGFVNSLIFAAIEGTGFEHILKLKRHAVHATTLLRSIVEYYDIENKCFTFNGINLFFGLGDVLRITGLPISGKAVIGKDLDPEYLCQQYLGTMDMYESEKGGIRLKALRTMIQCYVEGDDVVPYVRALIMFIIGSIITASSSNVVPLIFLQLLIDIKCIGEYAWGAALLAYLHDGLEKCKKHEYEKYLSGHSYFFMLFIMEHIPCIGLASLKQLPLQSYLTRSRSAECGDSLEMRNLEGVNLPNEFPLMLGWSVQLRLPSKDNHNRLSIEEFDMLLISLKVEEVNNRPYARLGPDFLPEVYRGHEKLAASFTTLICFEKTILHDPSVGGLCNLPSNGLLKYH